MEKSIKQRINRYLIQNRHPRHPHLTLPAPKVWRQYNPGPASPIPNWWCSAYYSSGLRYLRTLILLQIQCVLDHLFRSWLRIRKHRKPQLYRLARSPFECVQISRHDPRTALVRWGVLWTPRRQRMYNPSTTSKRDSRTPAHSALTDANATKNIIIYCQRFLMRRQLYYWLGHRAAARIKIFFQQCPHIQNPDII